MHPNTATRVISKLHDHLTLDRGFHTQVEKAAPRAKPKQRISLFDDQLLTKCNDPALHPQIHGLFFSLNKRLLHTFFFLLLLLCFCFCFRFLFLVLVLVLIFGFYYHCYCYYYYYFLTSVAFAYTFDCTYQQRSGGRCG